MDLFDAIRPYNDAEVPVILTRLSKDKAFLDSLIRFRYPELGALRMALLRPLLGLRLQAQLRGIKTVAQLQVHIEPYINRTIERSTTGVSWSGTEMLDLSKAHLFIANHRDIVMDPTFANYALYQSARRTLRIAIGDNLLQKPFVADLMRLNKSFIVQRSVTGRREKLLLISITPYETMANWCGLPKLKAAPKTVTTAPTRPFLKCSIWPARKLPLANASAICA